MKIIDIQIALTKFGLKPGPLDGIWGRQTAAAVRAFQTSKGLEVDGIVGPLTLAALLPGVAKPTDYHDPTLPWLQEALRLLGTREIEGKNSNKTILNWAKDLKQFYDDDDIPWCGLFVGHCIGSTLDREPLPSGLLSARAWERFGIKTKPMLGAVMVFWRKSAGSGLGHVGFYIGEDKDRTAYRIVGGNQSNQVSSVWISRDRFVAARWPSTVAPRDSEPATLGFEEPVSTTELPSSNEQ